MKKHQPKPALKQQKTNGQNKHYLKGFTTRKENCSDSGK